MRLLCKLNVTIDNIAYINFVKLNISTLFFCFFAQSVGAAEYTDRTSAEG